jgi:glyoxylase-like metal-dependent hydrolase (beta-lactamase superfamily II)
MYMESMRLTQAMPIETVFPGHGETFGDHAALIAERFAMHERRARKFAALIAEQPRTAHDIALLTWGNVAVTQAYLTLSEVLGHVDLLLERGEVVEDEEDGVVRFTTA